MSSITSTNYVIMNRCVGLPSALIVWIVTSAFVYCDWLSFITSLQVLINPKLGIQMQLRENFKLAPILKP